MDILRHISTFLLVAVITSVCSQSRSSEFFIHIVKKGESISLICIDYYGAYNNSMGNAIKKLNPSIKDINIIPVGFKIKLHKPEPISNTNVVNKSIFEKRVNIIQGVVTFVEGDALILKKGSNIKSKCEVNIIVHPGDIIETEADGRVEIIVNRESVIRMKGNTRLTFKEFRNIKNNRSRTSIDLKTGTLWTKVKKFAGKISRFELSLPTAIAGVQGTVYQTSVASDSTTEIKVYNGKVAVKNQTDGRKKQSKNGPSEVTGPSEIPGPHEVSLNEWTRIVRSMQKIKIGKNGIPGNIASFKKDPSSDWEKWNDERDKRISEIFMGK